MAQQVDASPRLRPDGAVRSRPDRDGGEHEDLVDRTHAAVVAAIAAGARSGMLVGEPRAAAEATLRQRDQTDAERAALRASVDAYVRELRDGGAAPEHMLVRVKDAVRHAMPSELSPSDAREVMDRVVRWSVEAYYHAA